MMKSSDTELFSMYRETMTKTRRQFLQRAGGAVFSASSIAILSGCGTYSTPASAETLSQDTKILNTAIAVEHEAIAAYQLGVESGLLSPDALKVAVKFQGHHKEHVDALSTAVNGLGAEPAKSLASYSFPTEKLKQESDVLQFAAGLERGAVSAYAGAIPAFENKDLMAAAASILADEAMHWAILRNALGLDPVPGAFFS